jgi:hypothetical protein
MAKKTGAKGSGKEVAKREASLPATVLERDVGEGFEGADRESYAIPFLVVLQKGSPQCDDADGAYIEGAKPGMFLNTATGELFDGGKGVVVVPAQFQRRLVEWVPREEGGGYRGDHSPDDFDLWKLPRDDSNRFLLDNGNQLVDTRYHFCIHITEEGPRPAVIAFTSTQIKKSRQWMTRMSMIKMPGKDGKKFTPPTYSHAYRITTVNESNDKGSWKGIKVATDHLLTESESDIYNAAKAFREQITSGQAKVEPPEGGPSGDDF